MSPFAIGRGEREEGKEKRERRAREEGEERREGEFGLFLSLGSLLSFYNMLVEEMESPASCSAGAPASDSGAQREKEVVFDLVDPFLVEALENPRHRLTGS